MRKNIIFICIIISFVGSCATMKSKFEKAKKINTIAAYESFLTKHPVGTFAADARKRIEEICFEDAKKENTIKAYESFLEKHPVGTFAADARKRIEEICFEDAKKENTIKAYESFLEKHPVGTFAADARKRIEEICFENAKKENTIKAYESFLEKNPDGFFGDEAIKRIEELSFENAKKKNTILAYKSYIDKYPESPYSEEVSKKIEEISFENSKEQNTIAAYKSFMKDYPYSTYNEDVNKIIDERILKLIQELQSKNREVLFNSLITLSIAGNKAIKALDEIKKLISKENESKLKNVAYAVRYIIDPKSKFMDETELLSEMLGFHEKFILEGLFVMTENSDLEIQAIAFSTIGHRIAQNLKQIDANLSNSPIPISMTIKDPKYDKSFDILVKNLKHKDILIRRSAAMSLAKIGINSERLSSFSNIKNSLSKSEAFKDSDTLVRGFVKIALGYRTGNDTQIAYKELEKQNDKFYSYK